MATVTRPNKSVPLPAAPAPTEPPAVADLDPLRSHFGDRIAFAVWMTCALFLAALLTYDTLIGLFR